jgi:hypothetical protein
MYGNSRDAERDGRVLHLLVYLSAAGTFMETERFYD